MLNICLVYTMQSPSNPSCHVIFTLQGTNTSPKNGILKMIFLFPRWDMLIPWRVVYRIASDPPRHQLLEKLEVNVTGPMADRRMDDRRMDGSDGDIRRGCSEGLTVDKNNEDMAKLQSSNRFRKKSPKRIKDFQSLSRAPPFFLLASSFFSGLKCRTVCFFLWNGDDLWEFCLPTETGG